MKQSDLFVGLQFEHLTVTSELRCIEKVTRKGGTRKARVIEVRCVCGTEKEVEAGNFLQGRIKSCGCNGVGIAVRDTESFIRAARETRGDFFDYSEVEYVNSYTSVKIIDPEFGPFWMLPGTHIRQGTGGHPDRVNRARSESRTKWTVEKIKAAARNLHGERYDLSRITKSGINQRFEVGCPDHGWWPAYCKDFITSAGSGCPKCRVKQLPIGYKKGRLTVIREPYYIPRKRKRNTEAKNRRVVDLQCDCGKVVEKSLVSNFLKDVVLSCGCANREIMAKVGAEKRVVFPGDRFGWLTVLDESESRVRGSNRSNHWYDKVRCSCGDIFWARRSSLTTGNTQSCRKCGLRRSAKRSSIPRGKRFGKLTILRDWGSERDGSRLALVKCGCSRQEIVRYFNLTSGNTSSCQACRHRKSASDRDRVEQYPLGFRTGRLEVLRHWGRSSSSQQLVLCQCDCGNQPIMGVAHIYYPGTNQNQWCKSCAPLVDTVEYFLQNHEWAERPCEFYVARIDERYTKPGIAFDYDSRADEHYKECLHIADGLNRAEQYVLEQIVLERSVSAMPSVLPPELEGWIGWSELRLKAMLPVSWYINQYEELKEELLDVGWLEMAHRHGVE